ncbi:universal stress protein [Nocardioides sp. AN3]
MAETGEDRRQDVLLVGVDGSSAADAAVRYASIEADGLGIGVRLLHVVPRITMAGLDDSPRLQRRREQVLGSAEELARTILCTDRVERSFVVGERVPTLVDAARSARMIVLGAPWHGRVDRLVTGSVVGGVASRATVPVVAVPEDWMTARERGRIVVGVKRPDDPASQRLVARAVEIAAARKCRLTVLHAWEFPVVYDEMIATTYEESAWSDIKRGSLEELVSRARGSHREVGVDYVVRHGQGAHALVDASHGADLVVITRRRHGLPFGYLGAPGRAVLRESRCPVEVIPPAELASGGPPNAPDEDSDLTLEGREHDTP